MSTISTDTSSLLDYAVACVPRAGDDASGDLYRVMRTERGALLGVLDSTGRGAEAIRAAHMAAAVVDDHANKGIIALIRLCHERLIGTRGIVIGLVSVDAIESTITWAGVGNIGGVLLRPNAAEAQAYATIPLQPGVLGYRLPRLQATVTPIASGDLLILATDGIRKDFVQAFSLEDRPDQIAEYISSNYKVGDESHLVLAARYQGACK